MARFLRLCGISVSIIELSGDELSVRDLRTKQNKTREREEKKEKEEVAKSHRMILTLNIISV